MRGKAAFSFSLFLHDRITPAYAGKRQASSERLSSCRDHPRLCGEKRRTDHALAGRAGITPAYAGKRLETASLIVRNQDHPRLCGEKAEKLDKILLRKGSPPPMRGKDSRRKIRTRP